MRPALRAHANLQRGLVTRSQCVAAGYTEVDLRGLLAAHGRWRVVRRGVYVERGHWQSLAPRAHQELYDFAAHLMMTLDHVMSHDSAARAHAIPMLRPRQELVHVTRQGVRGGRTEHGVKHHLTRFDLGDVWDAGGMPVTGPARTALDLAREHGRDMGVIAIDHVKHHGLATHRELQRELKVMSYWPGVRSSGLALELSDDRAESIAESLGRMLLVDLGFTDVDVAWPIMVDGRVYWCDLRVGCHLIEIDGLQKLLTPEEGGFARSTRDALRALAARQAAVCGEGLGMSRIAWDDLFGRRRDAAMDRLTAEEAVTRDRFGPELPSHLAESAARIRRVSPRRRTS